MYVALENPASSSCENGRGSALLSEWRLLGVMRTQTEEGALNGEVFSPFLPELHCNCARAEPKHSRASGIKGVLEQLRPCS